MELKGIATKMADKIIENRPYDSIEELESIEGWDKKLTEDFREELSVGYY